MRYEVVSKLLQTLARLTDLNHIGHVWEEFSREVYKENWNKIGECNNIT